MPTKTTRKKKKLTAADLRRLPAAKRNRILRAAAARAVVEYRTNRELTAFDAFGKDDLYGESASTEARRDLDG